MNKYILFTITTTVMALGLSACGSNRSGGSSGSTSVAVGQLKSATSTNLSSVHPTSTYWFDDAVAGSNSFAYAKVDGVKLTLQTLQANNAKQSSTLVDWGSTGKELEIGAGVTDSIQFSEDIKIAAGSYQGINLKMDSSYQVKAYCHTAHGIFYTGNDNAIHECTGSCATSATAPADYGYYKYNFLYVSTAESPTSTTDDTSEGSSYKFSVVDGQTTKLTMLIDNSYLVSCFDGQGISSWSSGSSSYLSPFGWSNNNGHATEEFFAHDAPNFGIAYIPLFGYVSTDASEGVPSGETYIASATAADVTGTINYVKPLITTMAFKTDGTLIAARSRNFDGGNGTSLNQMYSDPTTTSTDTYNIFNGEFFSDSANNYANPRPIQDRKLVGFTRISSTDETTWTTPFMVNVTDGPDCGATLTEPDHPEWGNRAKACGANLTTYWRRVPRN